MIVRKADDKKVGCSFLFVGFLHYLCIKQAAPQQLQTRAQAYLAQKPNPFM
ncbi:hypothetical protein HMPREF1254_2319 [Prevotella sp. BV3P1]|nr:hypothetical protein HMPREF1254_2319 [Prevotella sp. BV3P1]